MRIIYTYLVKELVTVTISTVAVLTFFLVLANIFKEVFDLLLLNEVSLWIIFKLVVLLIPFVLTFTLPWGLLLGVLLVFGRLSQEKELLALKASGIGLAPIVAPAIILALFCSAFTFWINASLGPRCRNAYLEIGSELASNNPTAFFASETTIEKFPGTRIWIGKKKGRDIEDVHIWKLDDQLNPVLSLRAERGFLDPDLASQLLNLHLFNAREVDRDSVAPANIGKIKPGSVAGEEVFVISLKSFMEKVKIRSANRLTFFEIEKVIFNPDELGERNPTPFLTEFQKRIAFSLACFTLVWVGIPLAIQTQRRETSVGVALSLAIALGYYFLTVLAEALKRHAAIYPEVITWAPNFIFQVLGAILLWRTNKR